MSAASLRLTVSTFPAGKPGGPAYGRQQHTTWSEFSAYLQRRREGEKDGPCFATAAFVLEPGSTPEAEIVRRLKANVTGRTMIALDIETNKKTGEVPPAMEETLDCVARNGWACAAYTSHNHQPDADVRYRLLLPMTEAVAADLPCPEVVADHLGVLGVLDTSKVGAASLFYFPSCPIGQADWHECVVMNGKPLNAGRLLAVAGRLYQARQAEQERVAAEAHAEAAKRRAERVEQGFNPDDSLIERLRPRYDLAAVLEAHGYDRAGMKFRHANSSSGLHGADIKVFGGIERVFSHNATYPLHADNLPDWCGTVTALDVVDVVTILAFGGDRRRALRELSAKHGLNKAAERKDLARLLFRLMKQRASQATIEQAAYAEGVKLGMSKQEVIKVAQWVAEQSPAKMAA